MLEKYYKCKQCKAILETWEQSDLECINCNSANLELTDNFLHEDFWTCWGCTSENGCDWCFWKN